MNFQGKIFILIIILATNTILPAQIREIYKGEIGGKQIFDLYLYTGDKVQFNYQGFEDAKVEVIESSQVDLGGIPILSDNFKTYDLDKIESGFQWTVPKEGGFTFNYNLPAVGDSWTVDYVPANGKRNPIRPLWINDYEYEQHRKDQYFYTKKQMNSMRQVASFQEIRDYDKSKFQEIDNTKVKVNDYSEDAFDDIGQLNENGLIVDPAMNGRQYYFERGHEVIIEFQTVIEIKGKDEKEKLKKIEKLRDESLFCNLRMKPMNFHYLEHHGLVRSFFPMDFELQLTSEFELTDNAAGETKNVGTDPYSWNVTRAFTVGASGYYSLYMVCWSPSTWAPVDGYNLKVYAKPASASKPISEYILSYYSEWDLSYLEPAEYMQDVEQKK